MILLKSKYLAYQGYQYCWQLHRCLGILKYPEILSGRCCPALPLHPVKETSALIFLHCGKLTVHIYIIIKSTITLQTMQIFPINANVLGAYLNKLVYHTKLLYKTSNLSTLFVYQNCYIVNWALRAHIHKRKCFQSLIQLFYPFLVR